MKAYKGLGMEGTVARWYTRTRANDMEGFRDQARTVATHLSPGARVLEVAPGPGFFAIQLATLGRYTITGLDISRTFVQIAQDNARRANVSVDFRLGNASAMPFPTDSFDFIYCSAAFKNFSAPVDALNEMHRVLRPGGEAWIEDLRKDISEAEVESYVRESGRKAFDAWITRWTFNHMLVKRAYTKADLSAMAAQSQFRGCNIAADGLGLRVSLTKRPAAA
jgi:ubiquinone/menaquinone biosynthesis C-methylase UbiE